MRTAALATLLAVLPACGGDAPTERPDVVLVVVDTLRADRLHAYGYPRTTSPWFDRMAEEGALFEDVTAQSGWTLPSMVSMLSGRYLTEYRDRLDATIPTMAEAFDSAGYATVGEVANVLLGSKSGFARGFDHYDARPAPKLDNKTRARDLSALAADLRPHLDAVLDDPDRPPLFLYIHPFDPHAPYNAHADFDDALPPDGAVPPGDAAAWRATYDAQVPERAHADERWDRAWANIQLNRARYDQEVRFTSDQLEKLFAYLEDRGVLENAVVAVVSDHGEGLWDHVSQTALLQDEPPDPTDFFYQEHGEHLYSEAIHTPLILWGRGVPAGLRVPDAVENVDLLPTLLDLCDVPARGEMHGRSLAPLLRGEAWEPKTHVFSRVLFHETVRETGSGWKLLRPTDQGAERERVASLYDLTRDPAERVDLIEARADIAERLDRLLGAWAVAYPTESTFGQKLDPELEELMGDIGYGHVHTGRASAEAEQRGKLRKERQLDRDGERTDADERR